MPSAYNELDRIRGVLEKHFHDMQDFEFTIQERKVFHAADPQWQAHGRGRSAHWPAKW